MKLINEKGKLFGVINVVDLVVILAVIAICAALAIKFMPSGVAQVVQQKKEVTIVTRIRGAMPYLYEELQKKAVGEKMVSGNTFVDAAITDVKIEDYILSSPTADGRIIKANDELKKDVIVTIKTTGAPEEATLKIGTQDVRVGRDLIVKTKDIEIVSICQSIDFAE